MARTRIRQRVSTSLAIDGRALPRPSCIRESSFLYNNINDTDAAFELVGEFDPDRGPACAIIKHANPCGVATGDSLAKAYQKALACDSVSAFGGIVAFNGTLDSETAAEVVKIFTEVIIAPDVSEEALSILSAKKKPAVAHHRRSSRPQRCGRYGKDRCRRAARAVPGQRYRRRS